jgi:hypothetical protein
VEILPVSREAFFGPYYVEDLAVIHTMTGDYEAAIDCIESILSIPSWLSVALLQLDPRWKPLHNHPRLQNLLKKYSR